MPREIDDIKSRWGRQMGEDWGYTIGPHSDSPYREEVSLQDCAADAAVMLRQGFDLYWEPGDGSSYRVALLTYSGQRWLAFLNPSLTGLLYLRESRAGGVTVGDYVRSSAPEGGWRGIRPLLVALGATGMDKPSDYDLANRKNDMHREAEERANAHRSQYVEDTDTALGREVRLLVEARRRG